MNGQHSLLSLVLIGTTLCAGSMRASALASEPPPPARPDVILLSEDFEGNFPPPGWTASPENGTNNAWVREDALRGGFNTTGGSGHCADAEVQAVCSMGVWDTTLSSPPINLGRFPFATLSFKIHFSRAWRYGEAWLEISLDGGTSWSNLAHWDIPRGPETETFDLARYVGRVVRLRWRYVDYGDQCQSLWRIDEVRVSASWEPPSTLFGQWQALPLSPMPGLEAAGAAVEGLVYVIGGETPLEGLVQVFNPGTHLWTVASGTMPIPAAGMGCAVIGADIYLIGGWKYSILDAVQVFHTRTRVWEVLSSDPLPKSRYRPACAVLDGRIYAIGGIDGGSVAMTDTVYVFDPQAPPGKRWSSATHAPVVGMGGDAVRAGGLVFYAGYVMETGQWPFVYAYDPGRDIWTEYPSTARAHSEGRFWALGTTLYLGGGREYPDNLSSVEQFDLRLGSAGTWMPTPAMIRPRFAFVAAVDGPGKVLYALGGMEWGPLASAEAFRARRFPSLP
jgi:hypothetical protein